MVPATAPRGHQRTRELEAPRFLQLAEGGQAGGAVDVQGSEDDPSGQSNIGLGPAAPPTAETVRVGGGFLDAVAD